MTNQLTNLAALSAALTQKIEHYMSNDSQQIHIHHHIHGDKPGGPRGRGESEGRSGKRRGRGPGGRRPEGPGPGGHRARHMARHSVLRAFGAVRRGGEISADEFSDLQEVQRDLEQRLADLSDLIETIEREGLITPPADADGTQETDT